MAKYGVRNAFLLPDRAQDDDEGGAAPARALRPRAALDHARRRVGRQRRCSSGRATRSASPINEMFGQTEMNYIVGNSHELWPAKPGSMGRPYPGHRVAVIDDDGPRAARRRAGRGRGAPHRARRHARPGVLPRVLAQPGGHAREVHAATGAAPATSRSATRDGDLWYRGRADDMFKAAGYRIGPSEIENCLVRHAAVANAAVVPVARRRARQRRQGVHRARAGPRAVAGARGRRSARTCAAGSRPTSIRSVIEFVDALPMTTTGQGAAQGAARARAEAREADAGASRSPSG